MGRQSPAHAQGAGECRAGARFNAVASRTAQSTTEGCEHTGNRHCGRAPYDIADVRTIRARGRTITLAGIEGFDQNSTCRARDGTRWSCAKLARDALRSRIGNQSLRCSTEAQASAVVFVATCTTSSGEDLARTLVADGWVRVLDDARQHYGAEAKAAEEQGLGLWGWRMEGKGKGR